MNRLLIFCAALPASLPAEDAGDPAFFESKIRPVLASSCYDCHGAGQQKGGLRLDWREGLLKGGGRGPAIIPGDPDHSLLIRAIDGSHPDLKMPKTGDPLSTGTVASFKEWIRAGAPDPRDQPPAAGTAGAADWPQVLALRKEWWCWQPLRHTEPPAATGAGHPVDRFLRAAMVSAGLAPAAVADASTRVRRAAFVLTGLPPSPEDVTAFSRDPSPQAWAALIDRYLASPHFGERWARHWMDWLRYAESHGSEGDPAVPYAWRYRDYLIRSLNAGVPYQRLVREHVAGDLLPLRTDASGKINDAAIGPAHLRMVFHGFTPTDALDEMVTFTDNQVDVVSKAFLGLTVSCARCHNHKFDAISQEDYYALYGIFANCRPAILDAAAPGHREARDAQRMGALKARLLTSLTTVWKNDGGFVERLKAWQPTDKAARTAADGDGLGPMAAWLRLKDLSPEAMRTDWTDLARKWEQRKAEGDAFSRQPAHVRWSPGNGSSLALYSQEPRPPAGAEEGNIPVPAPQEGRLLSRFREAGRHSDTVSTRQRGVLHSAKFKCEGGRLWVRASGNDTVLRYVVQNYPRSGLIYPKEILRQDRPGWYSWNLDYWKGESIYLELTTEPDAPIETGGAGRAWFGLHEVVYPENADAAPPPPAAPLAALTAPAVSPSTPDELAAAYRTAVQAALARQAGGLPLSAEEAAFLNFMLDAGLLPNTPAYSAEAAALKQEYRNLETSLPEPVRVPGVMEADTGDQALYVRGDHKKPSKPVPRRFLEAIDARPYHPAGSGRLELAASLVSETNPLTSRVIVNRLWHHVFGRGIVATTDNFGKLGDPPTHPELLDWLALRFQEQGGDIKAMLRLLLTSEAFQASAEASPAAAEKDPVNKLLSHFSLRRLEAEAIRDAILTVSGRLETDVREGPPADGNAPRRSVYVRVIRNALDPLLTAFDAPVPSSTRGRRDATSVPAQALALMNSPLIRGWAGDWADRITGSETGTPERIRRFFLEGFGREPSADEIAQCVDFIQSAGAQTETMLAEIGEWKTKLDEARALRRQLLEPVRDRLAKERATIPDATVATPLAEWDFEDDPGTSAPLPLTLHGDAKIEAGALVLNGGYASTAPLAKSVSEKTLEAWVQLDSLDQSGGGVLSLQSSDGDRFDSIVYGEKDPRQWLPGSDFFRRTQTTGGESETEAGSRPVHVALTYAGDGTITLWRNGTVYGEPYRSAGPQTFTAGSANVLIGLRHGEPGGNRLLRGRVLRARLYDRALSRAEIASSARLESATVSTEEALAALPPGERTRYDEAGLTAATAAARLAALTPDGQAAAGAGPWHSLALALINMKEFISLR